MVSSFGNWISLICAKKFTERVLAAKQYKYFKKLTTLSFLKLFLFAQLR
ncbi:DUF4372 domain-containing protein [Paenibacillus sp. EPM92]